MHGRTNAINYRGTVRMPTCNRKCSFSAEQQPQASALLNNFQGFPCFNMDAIVFIELHKSRIVCDQSEGD